MKEKEILITATRRIQEHLNSQENDLIKAGLYMALSTIKSEIEIFEDDKLLELCELNKNLEKLL